MIARTTSEVWPLATSALAESYLLPYLPVALFTLLVAALGAAMLGLSPLVSPRNVRSEKLTTYECGVALLGSARQQFSIKFYTIAILFVLFDIETVFLIPWAVIFRELGFLGLVEMLFFLGVLGLGLLYAWLRGGLDWQ